MYINTELYSALAANIYAQTIAARDYQKAQAEADKWEGLYQRALKTGSEDLVSEVQSYKDASAKKARNLKLLLDEQIERGATLKREVMVQCENSISTSITSSDFKSSEKIEDINASSQAMANSHRNDLETRLRNIESQLEFMKAQLLNQQQAMGKLLEENSIALKQVRTLLAEASLHRTSEAATMVPTVWKILESGKDM